MNLPWKRKLPKGQSLVNEAERLGVSLYGLPYPAKRGDGPNPGNEPELQARVLAARAERRNLIVSSIQTFGIIATLVLTIILAGWNYAAQSREQRRNHRWQMAEEKAQEDKESVELMLKFDERLNSGRSVIVARSLEMEGNLDKALQVDDEAIDEFLGNFELMAAAYRYNLINRDMAEDAFSYYLERAVNDSKKEPI
jgi:hypothetical protein